MSEAAQKLLEQIRALPEDDRRWIADRVNEESGGGYDPLEDPEFRAELDRTIEAVGNGTAVLIDGEEAFERIRLELEARRAARKPA